MSFLDSGVRAGLRSLSLAAVWVLVAGLGSAAAQTVMVRSAPGGAAIEVTLNGGAAVTATADNLGDATVAVSSPSAEADVQMHVDVCGNLVRVLIVARGLQPAAAAPGCTRSDMLSTFVMRPVTTFVVDISGNTAAVHISQGPPPIEWVARTEEALRRGRIHWGTPTTGASLFAGAGISSFSNQAAVECGTSLSTCLSDDTGGMLTAGAEYWIKPFAAVEVTYVRPGNVTINGSGAGFRFESLRQTRLFTIAGKGAFPTGPARIYGRYGYSRHESTSTTTQTVDDTTVTVDGVTSTVPGGTQSFGQKTSGWNWLIGGGVEAWVTRWVAIYGDIARLKIKGTPEAGGEGGIDDTISTITIGVKLRIGR